MRLASRWLARAGAAALALACASSPPPAAEPAAEPVSDGRYVMGTVLEMTLHGVGPEAGRDALDALFAEAARLDALLSVYREDSALSRLNRRAGRGPQPVGPALAEVLALSVEYAELTAGSFDVTIGPLVELWARAAERDRLPSPRELASVRERVGAEGVRVDPLAGTAELARQGMVVNLGGIAKGYALDRMLPLLRAHGVDAALLNFGQSSTWAVGSPREAPGWRLLVRGPDGGFVGVVTLRDRALSVSGSLGQWVEIAGRRYGHILDPRSGKPLLRQRQAVVVAPEAALAEALGKALLVLHAAEGLALVAAQPGCEGLLVEGDGALHATPGWQRATRFEPLEAEPAAAAARRAGRAQAGPATLRFRERGTRGPPVPDLQRGLPALR